VGGWGLGLACEGGAVHGQSVKSMLRIMHEDNLHSAIFSQGVVWFRHKYSLDASM